MQQQRIDTLAFARGLVAKRVRWRHRGRTPWAVDCVGLIVLSLHAAGLNIEDEKHYGREPWKDGVRQKMRARFGEPIAEDLWQPGDIAVFKSPQRSDPSHVGFLGDYPLGSFGDFSLIHAHADQDCREHVLDARWRRLLVEVYSPWAL
ncbi:NlpC/P60 family protein [Microbulbifer sp. DLAB2-AA]|uniref:NlpC/P60 family protein n=1 Tax=Microbulbifer sp. DLAB2-AA TaxID=3243394 RepID=UPI00403976FA